MRYDQHYKLFWESVTKNAADCGVEEPVLPLKRKSHVALITITAVVLILSTLPRRPLSAIYFETLDTVISCIEDRFNQGGFQI